MLWVFEENIRAIEERIKMEYKRIDTDQMGACFGGHLNAARVSATCEMVITVLEGTVDRFHDDATGLNLFRFQ